MKRTAFIKILLVTIFITQVFLSSLWAQVPPHALVVIAHPDDESILAVTLYKLTKEQQGTVDLYVITNGEAGYRYSTLAELYYGCTLTNVAAARKKLPAIRKRELREAGAILGITHIYFGNQQDSHYSLDERGPLDTSWQVPVIQKKLRQLITRNHYDYVFCLLPSTGTHGGHKAATLLALDAVATIPADKRPVILGAALRDKKDTIQRFNGLDGYEQTGTAAPLPLFTVDRTVSFSYKNKINYKIIADWELSSHKSQGATQMTMNDGDLEEFWYFAINGPNGQARTAQLYNKLDQSPYANSDKEPGSIPLTAQLKK